MHPHRHRLGNRGIMQNPMTLPRQAAVNCTHLVSACGSGIGTNSEVVAWPRMSSGTTV